MIQYNNKNFEALKKYLDERFDYRATNDEVVEFVGYLNELEQCDDTSDY